ncbi:CD276 antigen [Myotis lucifugus]|uniref:CD276 antigen n=1 Tax=Myotis lucifugus TaxID=59463 RepID=UPI000CCBE18D|nr:CD276 antigen [Myotis lucifugus]
MRSQVASPPPPKLPNPVAIPSLVEMEVELCPSGAGSKPGVLPSGRAQAFAPNPRLGANPASGRTPPLFRAPGFLQPAPPRGLPGRPPTPIRSGLRWRRSAAPAPLSPGSREWARRGAAGEAFRHREPSCQLPQKKMGSPGTGVRAATTLGVLWFFFTGAVEGPGPRRPCGGPAGAPDATLRCSFSPEPGFSLEQLNSSSGS